MSRLHEALQKSERERRQAAEHMAFAFGEQVVRP